MKQEIAPLKLNGNRYRLVKTAGDSTMMNEAKPRITVEPRTSLRPWRMSRTPDD
jgi:hypothetical protein